MQIIYPFNVMRNLALISSVPNSPFVFLLDIDFHIFPVHHSHFESIVVREYNVDISLPLPSELPLQFLIIPAFETINPQIVVPQTFQDLFQLLRKRKMIAFCKFTLLMKRKKKILSAPL